MGTAKSHIPVLLVVYTIHTEHMSTAAATVLTQRCCVLGFLGSFCLLPAACAVQDCRHRTHWTYAGGQQEYEAVRQQLSELNPDKWTITEHKFVNRPAAPVLLCAAGRDMMLA